MSQPTTPLSTDPFPGTTAWSVDGTTFTCAGPFRRGLQLGGYVHVSDEERRQRIGQILDLRAVEDRSGRTLHAEGRFVDREAPLPVADGTVRPASSAEVRDLLAAGPATLPVGSLRSDPEVEALLRPTGFNRHTFLCGQSGSGKTYSLGVLLEQVVLGTSLPIIVLDPNGDHVHLGATREDVDSSVRERYGEASGGTRILRASAEEDGAPLRVRFNELGLAGIAALLGLDPIRDREEYNALVALARRAPADGLGSVEAASALMAASSEQLLDAVRMRTENLGVDEMMVWSRREADTIIDHWERERPRALVADTSGFDARRERLIVAVAVLQHLWRERRQRRPLLLVVDEAHDACPADPADPLERLATELFTRVAGEGRKYGIHLLLATQRPDKLPDNVLTQCDNLVLMRVNSAGDRQALVERFGFAPPRLIEMAASFRQGEVLLAGDIAPVPMLARMGTRITPEGGGDLGTQWAEPAPS